MAKGSGRRPRHPEKCECRDEGSNVLQALGKILKFEVYRPKPSENCGSRGGGSDLLQGLGRIPNFEAYMRRVLAKGRPINVFPMVWTPFRVAVAVQKMWTWGRGL